jgi:hypothetical protein
VAYIYIYSTGFYLAIKKNENVCRQMDGLENIMLSKVSQSQEVRGHMFSLLCGSQTYKLNVYIKTYHVYIHTHTHTYIHTYIYIVRENKIIIVSLSKGLLEAGRERKMLEN